MGFEDLNPGKRAADPEKSGGAEDVANSQNLIAAFNKLPLNKGNAEGDKAVKEKVVEAPVEPAFPVAKRGPLIAFAKPFDEPIDKPVVDEKEQQRELNRAERALNPLYRFNGSKSVSDEEIAGAIDKLDAPDFATRNGAIKFLEEVGENALPALKKNAKESTNLQVEFLAKSIADRIEIRSVLAPGAALIDPYYELLETPHMRPSESLELYREIAKALKSIDKDKLNTVTVKLQKDPEWHGSLPLEDLHTIHLIMQMLPVIMPNERWTRIEMIAYEKNNKREAIYELTQYMKKDPSLANDWSLCKLARELHAIENEEFAKVFNDKHGDLLELGIKFTTDEREEKYLRERLDLFKQGKVPIEDELATSKASVIQIQLVDNLLRQKKPEEAESFLESGKYMPSEQEYRLFAIADLYSKQGNSSKADNTCQKLETLRDSYIAEQADRAKQHGDNVLVAIISSSADFDHKLGQALDKVATLYLQNGDKTQAIAVYDRALIVEGKGKDNWRRSEASTTLLAKKGRILLEDGKIEEANKCFTKGIEMPSFIFKFPGKAMCLAGKANIEMQKGNAQEALKNLGQANFEWEGVFKAKEITVNGGKTEFSVKCNADSCPNIKEWLRVMKDLRKALGADERYIDQAKRLDWRIIAASEAIREYEKSTKTK